MQLIPTRIHAVIDYIVAVILIGLPYLFDAGFGGGPKVWVPMALGALTIVYSLLTAYELGVVSLLPMPVHLVIDGVSGAFLAASPFLFGFASETWIPYVLIGLFEIAASLLTSRHPGPVPGLRRV